MNRRRIAFVVPRFGEQVMGGAETLARGFAIQTAHAGLAAVEVFTTCATSHLTWHNQLPAGTSDDQGVTVHRFHVDAQRRNVKRYAELMTRIAYEDALSLDEQLDWVANSVQSPALYAALARAQDQFDFFFFIPYLFGTTFYGTAICPHKAILWPCLHDEPYAHLGITKDLFEGCLGVAYNAAPEQALAERLYGAHPGAQVIGSGLSLPSVQTPTPTNPDRFRSKHNLHGPFVLYVGRLEGPKNIGTLIDYFCAYKRTQPGPLKLVLMGDGPAAVPDHPDVIRLGFQPEQDKRDAMAAASVLCQPSVNESFSIVIMEAWLQGTPMLVHADCDVTRYHAVQSNGGLYFAHAEEFEEALTWLLSHESERKRMGENGKRYVAREYNWPAVLARFERAMGYWEALRLAPSPHPSPVLTGEGARAPLSRDSDRGGGVGGGGHP